MFSFFRTLTNNPSEESQLALAGGASPLFVQLMAVIFAAFLATALVSCGGKEEPEPIPEEPEPEPEAEVVEEEPEPIVVEERKEPCECIPNCTVSLGAVDDPSSNLVDRTVNFEFDKTDLNGEDQDTLCYHAEYLTAQPGSVITIDGHADERGSREYNLALGYRRANSVKSFFVSKGIAGNQLKVRSFGEDNPVVSESNEYSWAQNRRAEIVYK
ncbi:MAG: OmpA family protein [Gammaproteobacteria bacterium]|nr:OmpA family protein [Gammaproteobacteria bacterium]